MANLLYSLEDSHILTPGHFMKKLRELSFLQLQTLEKIMYPYFLFVAQGLSTGWFCLYLWENCHISTTEHFMNIIWTLSFLQHWKLEKWKCSYFFIIFSGSALWQFSYIYKKCAISWPLSTLWKLYGHFLFSNIES